MKNINKISSLNDIFDQLNKDITLEEFEKVCCELRELKIKQCPHIKNKFRDFNFDELNNFSNKSNTDITKKEILKYPLIFKKKYAEIILENKNINEGMAAFFIPYTDQIYVSESLLAESLNDGDALLILAILSHELEHYSQKYDEKMKKEVKNTSYNKYSNLSLSIGLMDKIFKQKSVNYLCDIEKFVDKLKDLYYFKNYYLNKAECAANDASKKFYICFQEYYKNLKDGERKEYFRKQLFELERYIKYSRKETERYDDEIKNLSPKLVKENLLVMSSLSRDEKYIEYLLSVADICKDLGYIEDEFFEKYKCSVKENIALAVKNNKFHKLSEVQYIDDLDYEFM